MIGFLFYSGAVLLWTCAMVRLFFMAKIFLSKRYDLLDERECVDVICDVLRSQTARRGLIVTTPGRTVETQFLGYGDGQTLYWDIPHRRSSADSQFVDNVAKELDLLVTYEKDGGDNLILLQIPIGTEGKVAVRGILERIFRSPLGCNLVWL